MSADELPSWRETTAKQSIVEFVAAVTDPDSPDFIPERDRIAVFDNDGTLWTEQPIYAQLVFALDRAAELGHPTSLEELHAGGMEALIKLLALTHAGITTDEFDAMCRSWLASARHPRFGRPYPATVYLRGCITRPSVLTWALCPPLILVDEGAKDRPPLDPLMGEVRNRVIGPGRAELAAAMGPPPVVIGLVLGQDRRQVPLAEDQHPVGDLRPGSEHEPLRVSVRFRASRRDLHDLDTSPGQDGVIRCGELPGRSRIRNRKPAARSPRSISGLRICCTVHGPSGFAVIPRMCT